MWRRVWPECLRVWVMRLLLWLKAFPHTTHLCGFSPVIITVIIITLIIIISIETFLLDKLGIYTCCQKVFCEILWVLFYKNGSCQNLCCTHSPETHIWPKPFWYINNFTRTHTLTAFYTSKRLGYPHWRILGQYLSIFIGDYYWWTSPVWMYVCFFMSDFWWNRFPQYWQGYGLQQEQFKSLN